VVPAATATPLTLPTLAPTPTAFDPTPRVTATINANVRSGDGTNYPVVGALLNGQSAPVVGVSAYGTGWYLIELPDGRRGWISPQVVTFNGDISTVPRIEPPPPPATPTPPFTPTPVSQVNLVAGNFSFVPGTPTCNVTFNIYIDVANFGTVTSPSTIISVIDLRRADGTQQGSTIGGVPPIAPGQTINVGPIPLTISTYYNEEHRLLMIVDPNNSVIETNEFDNTKEAIYTLQKGSCP
jgi:hypothetical protein